MTTVQDFNKNENPLIKQQILAGTPNYMSPEVLFAAQNEPAEITYKMDNFSIGSILYFMYKIYDIRLSGTMAFDSESPADILHRTMEGSYALNDRKWKKISTSAKNLVSALLQVEPKDRISLDDALKHPWFN